MIGTECNVLKNVPLLICLTLTPTGVERTMASALRVKKGNSGLDRRTQAKTGKEEHNSRTRKARLKALQGLPRAGKRVGSYKTNPRFIFTVSIRRRDLNPAQIVTINVENTTLVASSLSFRTLRLPRSTPRLRGGSLIHGRNRTLKKRRTQ